MEQFADWQDAAAEMEEEQRNDAIAAIRRQAQAQTTKKHKKCVWCAGKTAGGAKYCGPDCRQDAEREEAARKRNGGLV